MTEEELLKQQQQNLYSQAQAQTPATTATTATYINDAGQKETGLVQPNANLGYYDRMRDYQGQIYADTLAANNQALADAQDRAQEVQAAQKAALAAGYQGTNRQLYRDYMEHRRTLPQEMAAAGYSGGLSESSNVRLRNSYEEALANNERARLAEEAGIDQTYAQQAYEAKAAANAANREARQNQYSYLMALEEDQQQHRQNELVNRANTMASVGDFGAYKDLGYSQAEIDYLTRMWLQNNPAMKDTWIAQHPEEAKRLGLVTAAATAARGGGGGGVYAPAEYPAETGGVSQLDMAAIRAARVDANTPYEVPGTATEYAAPRTAAEQAAQVTTEAEQAVRAGASQAEVEQGIIDLYSTGQISARAADLALQSTRLLKK